MSARRWLSACLAILWLGACLDTGQRPLSFPLYVAGTPAELLQAGEWEVELSEAWLAFGPLYLCGNESAGEGCEVARGEWLQSVEVDLLSESPQRAGELQAVEGEVRSLMYDVGHHWPLTEQAALPTEAAESIGGGSVHLVGIARRDGLSLPFEATVEAAPVSPGQVTASGQLDAHDLRVGEQGLLLAFDPERLVRDIRFGALLDDDGQLPDELPVQVRGGTQAERAIVQGLAGQLRPAPSWGFVP